MKIIDLSHPISNDMSTYPTDPDVSIVREKNIKENNSLLHSFKMGTHTGTHLDTPAHIIRDGKTINDFPLEKFTGLAIKIDKGLEDKLDNYSGNVDGIIYNTGWFKYFDNPKKYYSSSRPIIPDIIVEFAVSNELKFFGCDLPSVDKSGSKQKEVHNALLKSDIILYESLANLEQLPNYTPFNFFGFPLPFSNLEGSPVRAAALL